MALKPIAFEWDPDTGLDNEGKQIGLKAQDVLDIIPEVVRYDEMDRTHSVAYQNLVPVLIQAIHELSDQVKALRQEVQQMKGEDDRVTFSHKAFYVESITIPKTTSFPAYLDFNRLRETGIKHLEELGSDLWTDFNLHDPGITILETLVYALTDLGIAGPISKPATFLPAARRSAGYPTITFSPPPRSSVATP